MIENLGNGDSKLDSPKDTAQDPTFTLHDINDPGVPVLIFPGHDGWFQFPDSSRVCRTTLRPSQFVFDGRDHGPKQFTSTKPTRKEPRLPLMKRWLRHMVIDNFDSHLLDPH